MQFRFRLRFALADLRLACDLKVALTARDAHSGPYDEADRSAVSLGGERRLTGDPEIQGPRDPDVGEASSYGVKAQA